MFCNRIPVYKCEFDDFDGKNSFCQGSSTLNYSSASATFSIVDNLRILNTNYRINDWSAFSKLHSISIRFFLICYYIFCYNNTDKPTKLNNYCIIPYTYNSDEYNYCAYRLGNFQCLVKAPDSFDTCNLGKFLQAQSRNGDAFEASTRLNMRVPETGKYTLNMHGIMYCNLASCNTAQDFIEIGLAQGNGRNLQASPQRFYLKDFQPENKWLEKKLEFEVVSENEKDINVI